ncbi:polyketide synthase-nonribosomal peptide synthetase hybrid himA-like [Patiria miniata]|uniref:oleoyl-[acyl-carrier-protein] hydrolase n=1 Tax=Patiria miniata TaxID=46514 RepID=A0A914A1F2_PATMI|nr:polyketide synthase-nonribosomal peptide synthetase hybrid himA-like [Patiria miniata]
MDAGLSRNNQKVAIVGIGCRYGNGIDNVRKFWEMLVKGLDCTTSVPADRFDASYFLSPGEKRAGKMYIKNGGYISQDPYMFDRQFFHMPPDEAAHLDPQVRLLLEVTWEALENAGIPASSIRGSRTGVYMGVTAQEYSSFAFKPLHNMNQYSNSGTNSCMVSNRISYEFDLRGPSFSVDTACSSSLYSIHLACEALKQKSCTMALAGGVNLILTPVTSIGFCQAGMLSGDGKCKSFDQSADGYSRSEGAGVVVLKPLSEALRNGDRVYAVLRGGALSNDGRTPGIANPSFDAQVDLVKSACRNARVDPYQIVYAEAHGTGTQVGDTTEAGALGEAMGRRRGPKHPPFYIGSVKSNVGHSEGAAGVAGIIKAALCLYQRKIPPVVHFKTPNENIDCKALKIKVPIELIPWPDRDGRLLASCSSFGFGGANANIVLEGPTNPHGNGQFIKMDKKLSCLLLSASSSDALHQKVKDWLHFLTDDKQMTGATFFSCLYTAACRSQHHTHRMGFAINSKKDAIHQLRMKLEAETQQTSDRSVEGVAPSATGTERQIVFVFSGMGTQWWGMARELMHTHPAFFSKMKVVDKLLQKCGAKWSLVSMLSEEQDRERINQTEISQPCLFAVAIGLVDLWKLHGVVPDAVVGHSVGEVASAYAAGLLSLEHAVKLIYRRGRELRKTSGSGKMVAVLHRVEDVLTFVSQRKHGQVLDVAAINSPGQIVFSGETSAVEGIAKELTADNIQRVVLKVNNAFHSKQQEVVKKPFLKKVGKFLKVQNSAERQRTIPMMSTVTGRYLTPEEANSPEYWFQNIRQKVSFMESIQNLAKDGYRVFVEIGPHSSLLPALRETLAAVQATDDKFITTASLLRPRDTTTLANDSENLLLAQMRLHVSGIPAKFHSLFMSTFRRVVSVPHYPWQREKCTNVSSEGKEELLFPAGDGRHILLGEPMDTFYLRESPVKIWRADLNASRVPWVQDHVLQGAVVVPAAAYTETALAAARSMSSDPYPLILSGLTFDRFMFASNCEGTLETTVEEKTPDQSLFTLRSHDASRGTWIQHCHLKIIPPSVANLSDLKTTIVDVESIIARCEVILEGEEFYTKAASSGFELGATFRGVQNMSMSRDFLECLLYADAPPSVQREFHRYVYHPAFMDSFLQAFAVLLLLATEAEIEATGKALQPMYRVPRSIKTFTISAPTSPHVCIHMKIGGKDQRFCDIDVADADTKKVFCSVRELVFETIQTDKMEPQVWSLSSENVGSVVVTNRPSEFPLTKKKVVLFPDDTEVSTSFVDSLVNVQAWDVTVVDTTQTDAVQQAFTIVSDNNESDTLVIIMKTEVYDVHLNSGTVMSRDEFEECQKGMLFCYSVLKAILDEGIKNNLKVILFTKGAQRAREEDDVNPFAAILNTIAVTVGHEEPSIRVLGVDLPMNASSLECAKIAREIMYKEDHYLKNENVIAVRTSNSTNQDDRVLIWDLRSPRLKMENISKASGVVPTRFWSVGEQKVSDRNRVFFQKTPSEKFDNTNPDTVHVKVEAFSVCNRPKLEGDSHEGPNTFVYAGRVDPSESNDVCETYLGLTSCKVKSYMPTLSQDVVPSHLTPEEAVSIVNDYFPTAVFFNEAFQISAGMRLVFKFDPLDSCGIAMIHLSTKLGAEVVLLSDGRDDLAETKTEIHVRCLSEIDDASVDALFLSCRSPSFGRTVQSLLPKLRRNATVVIMQKPRQDARLPMLPSKMKIVTFNTDLQSAVDGLSSGEISATLSNLWEMFDPNVEGSHLTCKTYNVKEMSSLLAQNADIPKSEVIEVGAAELMLPPSLENDGFVADGESAYLITGGTKGFGLRLLEWLIKRGARYIYTGSRGVINDELQVVIHKGEEVGATVRHIQLDVSNATDVEKALQGMKDDQWPALKGIFHCAAVFSDGFIQNITAESWNSVMAPKAYGALLLHQLTLKLGIKLDHFIMTSSIVSLMGNAGQASYCASNVFLNALAQYRLRRNLPATAVQLGLINGVGFAVRHDLVQMWEKTGVESMSPEEALGVIGCALSVRQSQLGISGLFNRKLYAATHRGLMMQHFREKHGTISLMKELFQDRDVYLTATNDTLLQSILKLPFAKAREVVIKTLAKLLSEHLGLSDEPPKDASPIALGVDSLMASEVSQMISQQFEVTVGAVDLLNDKNTIQQLSKNIARQILAKADSTSPTGFNNEVSFVSKKKNVIVEGEVPKSLGVKLVCFPSNGAGPSLFSQWIQHLLPFGIQVLMIQLPGWEGRESEQPLKDMKDIARLVHDELKPHILGFPCAFFGHSMGSLIAFEVSHLLLKEESFCLRHLFVSAWYAPTTPYPHQEELNISPETFERLRKTLENHPKLFAKLAKMEQVKFSFMDDRAFFNTALMRRLLPCIEAAIQMVKSYDGKHQKPLPCDITAVGGKQDGFVQPELLDGWELERSKKHNFKKITLPGRHMYILTNTAEIVKEICLTCKKVGIN